MRSQKNVTILSYIVAALAIILIIIYMVDYKVKDENNFYQSVVDNSQIKYNSVTVYLEANVDKELQEMYAKTLEFVDGKHTFDDESFMKTIKVNGNVSLVPESELTNQEKSLIASNIQKYYDDDHILLLIMPIYRDKQLIGAIMTQYDNHNYQLLLKGYNLSLMDKLYVIDDEGQYLYGQLTYNNIIDVFSNLQIVNKSINNILEHMQSKDEDLLKIKNNQAEYYFYYQRYQNKYIIFESDAAYIDQNHLYSNKITTNFIMRTVMIISVFFVYVIVTLFYRHRYFRKKELQIATLNNSINGGIILASLNNDLRILYGNDGFYSLVGYGKNEISEIFDNCLRRLVYPDDVEIFNSIIPNLKGHQQCDYKLRFVTKDRGIIWLHLNISFNIEKNDTATIVLLDITESKIRNNEIKSLIASIPGSVLKINALNWRIEFASDSLFAMLGYSKEEFRKQYQFFHELIYHEDLNSFINETQSIKDNITFEVRLVKKDGQLLWISFNGKRAMSDDNHDIYQSVIIDISEEKDTLIALRKESDRVAAVLEMTDEFIFEYLISEDVFVSTKKYSEYFNRPRIIKNFYQQNLIANTIIHPDDISIITDAFHDLTNIQQSYQFDVRVKERTGKYEWYNVKCSTLYEDGKPYKLIIKLTNIDNERQKLERLLDISQRDSLSGLYNNSSLARNINDYLSGNGQYGNHCFILFDIDDFKGINDRYGHLVGDAMIKEYSQRLQNFFTTDDIIGRIGGDEFGVLLKNTNRKVAFEIMNRLHDLFQDPLIYEDKKIPLFTSYGISVFPYDGMAYEELFKKADVACYYSKGLGKNFFTFYDESMSNQDHEFKNLTYRSSKTDKLLLDTIQLLGKSSVIVETVKDALLKICEHFNFDYAYVFEGEETYESFHCTYAFDKANVNLESNLSIHNPASVGLMGTIKKDSILYISDLATLANELPDLYQAMMKEKTKSVIITGIFEQGELRGLMGFGSYETIPYPAQQEIVAIVAFVRLLMNHIYKLRENQRLGIGNQLFQSLISNHELSAYAIDIHTYELLYISPRLKKTNPQIQLHGKCYEEIYHHHERCLNCPLKFIGNNMRYSTHLYDENTKQWLGVTASKLELKYEQREAALVYAFDISSYIETVSYRDPLTGLSNLSKFILEGNKILKNNHFDNTYCLVATDITYLSYINETLGYDVGDRLLINLSETIHQEIQADELCCYSNNNKFLMLLKNDSNNLVKRLIRFRRRCLNVFEKIIGYSNSSFTTGLYFVKASDEEITEAINKAELARHTSLNVHQTGVYNEAILEVYEREKYLEKMMETSISNEEFKLYYLPKYEINSLEMVGLEVLTRWHSPLEIISPSEYVPLFEKNGFIDKLTYYTVEQVAKTLKDWQERGLNILPVAINVSYNTLINRQFVTNLIQIVDKYEIDHKLIEIELQELVFKENVQSIVEALNKVRSAGFNTTIDDFGTGYSSLVMLKALPVDTLKLDKVFLKNGIIEENDYIIIKNIINMSKELGIKIVSEGVETEEQLDFLKKSGCQYVQGFYLCRPVMLEELEKKMKKN